MSNKLAKALDTCIIRMGQGDSVETCLSDYPGIEEELRELLDLYTLISKSPKVAPSESFKRQSKARVMADIQQSDMPERKQSKQVSGERQSLLQTILSPRRVALPAIGLVVLVVASILFANMFGLWAPTPALAQPCVLSTLSGSVELKEAGSDAWISGTDGAILASGSLIKTDSNSHALLTFFDGSTMKLEPEAAIEIKEIEYRKQQDTRIIVKQLSGVTWSHVSKTPEPGSHFRVETPSAEIIVQGTSFTIEVDEAGFTRVAATEGSVTVSAQKQEIHLAANQQTKVNAGSAPTLPMVRSEALSKLLIEVELPGVVSVRDPNGASTGCFPDGISFNQIKDSLSEILADGRQLITIPQPENGRYTLAIRNTEEQSVRLSIKAVSEGEAVFEHNDQIGGTRDSDRIMHLNINVEGGKIISGEIVRVEPLIDQVPEKVVITELAVERAAPLKNTIEEAEKQRIETSEEVTPSRPDDLSENITPDKQEIVDEEIIRTDRPRLEDKKPEDALGQEGTEEGEVSTEADVTEIMATDNAIRIDRQIQEAEVIEVTPDLQKALDVTLNKPAVLNWDATEFLETMPDNDGSIATVLNLTLTNETFVVTDTVMTRSTHYTVANAPNGLRVVITVTSGTTATVALSGKAAAHAAVDSINNLAITFFNAAFTGGKSSMVTGHYQLALAVTFYDHQKPTSSLNATDDLDADNITSNTPSVQN